MNQNSRKVITNIQTGQNSDRWSRRSRWVNRTQTEDRNQDMREFVQKELTDQKLQQEILKEFVMNLLMDQQLKQGKLKEFVMSSFMDQKLEQENMKEFMVPSLMNQQLKQDDDVTDQSVNQSRTIENDSERDVNQIRIQEKVETTCLFDTGADAHVMPKHVWEQLGEPTLHTTRVTLRGANGFRGFIEEITVLFTEVVAQDARRCLLGRTQLRTKGCTFTLHQHRSFFTQPNWQRDGNDVTRRKQRHSQSCVHDEAKICTFGNF